MHTRTVKHMCKGSKYFSGHNPNPSKACRSLVWVWVSVSSKQSYKTPTLRVRVTLQSTTRHVTIAQVRKPHTVISQARAARRTTAQPVTVMIAAKWWRDSAGARQTEMVQVRFTAVLQDTSAFIHIPIYSAGMHLLSQPLVAHTLTQHTPFIMSHLTLTRQGCPC